MAAQHWTESQKARQRGLIQQWQPWKLSTGAKSVEGKTKVSQNALKSGNYTAAALQADREYRQLMKEYQQFLKEDLENMQYIFDILNGKEISIKKFVF